MRRVNLANLCIGPLILLGSYGLSRRRRNQPPTGLRYHRTTTALRSQPFCGPKGERLLLARASATRRGARFISRLFDSDLSSGQEVAQGCGSGARSIARGITTVFTVLAGASKLVGDLIRSPIHSSVPSINASTPNVRRTNAVSRVNRGRRKWAVCSGVVVRIRNSTGDPPPAQRPPLQTTI